MKKMDHTKKIPTPLHNSNARSSAKKSNPTNRGQLNETVLSSSSRKPNSTIRQLNETVYSSLSRKPNSTNKGQLNETVYSSFGSSYRNEHSTMKSTASSIDSTHILETECDLGYNNYLQALMKQEIVDKEVMQKKHILQGQLNLQSENFKKQKDAYKETMERIHISEKETRLMQLINALEENIERLKTVSSVFQTQSNITKLVSLLRSESDKIVFKNFKLITTQEEYNKLFDVLDSLNATMAKILKSGHNFGGIHVLANEVKCFVDLDSRVSALQTEYADLEKRSLFNFLLTLSDNFAKQYVDLDASE